MKVERSVLQSNILLSQPYIYAFQRDIYKLDFDKGILYNIYRFQKLVGPTIYNGAIYVNYINDSTVEALHATNGEQLWTTHVEGHLVSSPNVLEDIVYVSVSEGYVYALQRTTGFFLWKIKIDSNLLNAPTIYNGTIFIAATDSLATPSIYALNSLDGSLIWYSTIKTSTIWPLAVSNSIIYISTNEACCALQASDGSLIWEQEIRGGLRSSPVIMDGIIFISYFEPEHQYSILDSGPSTHICNAFVASLRASDGLFLWKKQLGLDSLANYPTSPVSADNKIYVGTDDGCLSALQSENGHLLWKYKTGGRLLSSPVVGNRTVLIGANDGKVYALRTDDGSLLWQTFVSDALTISGSDLESSSTL